MLDSARTRYGKNCDFLPQHSLSSQDTMTTRDVRRTPSYEYRWTRSSSDRGFRRTMMDHGFCLSISTWQISRSDDDTRVIPRKISTKSHRLTRKSTTHHPRPHVRRTRDSKCRKEDREAVSRDQLSDISETSNPFP